MKRLSRMTWLVLLATLVLNGCGGAPTPAVIPTRTPQPTFTPTPDWTPTPALAPTKTPTPEPTATPTPAEPPTAAPTNTPDAKPAAIVTSASANVRSGPGTGYPLVGRVNRGDRLEINGKNDAGTWWQVCCVASKQGWIIGDLVRVEGDAASVPIVSGIAPPPPAPTRRPTATPLPTQPPAPPPTAAPAYPFFLLKGVERCDPNPGTTYFSGFVRYKNNNPRNGVCVHIAFYGPRQTKCSGCSGVGDGVWGFSPFGPGAPPIGTTVELFVVSCPANFPAGGQDENTGFGDLTPRSDKWVYTIKEGVQCTGVTFVGD